VKDKLCECGCDGFTKSQRRFIKGHNRKGTKTSQESLDKRKATLLEPEFNKIWRQKLSAGWTEEAKEKLRQSNLGKTLTEEHKKKIGKANSGLIRTHEVKQKISNSLKGKFIGELNPMYIHGNSNKNKIIRGTYEYKYWRKCVFERDNYTCQHCGISNVYVTAHHIKSFVHYPELRFELDNGLTLCEECHIKTDNYKGRNRTYKNK